MKSHNNTPSECKEKIKENIRIVGDCWEWDKAKDNLGYGFTRYKKRQQRVHRLSAHIYHGMDLDDKNLFALHKCDNPSCCNPEHIYVGSKKDNCDDMMARKRNNQPKGESHHKAKLTEKDVKNIRKRFSQGEYVRALAREYQRGRCTIRDICLGVTWKHI